MSVDKIDLTPEDFNALVNENGNKFNSTILEIFSKRADNVEPSNLLNNYQRKSSLYEPSKIDPRVYNEISNIFFDTVSKDFDCIELSPISPLGLNSVLTATNQNNVLSASRNSEVISDSAIAMALECAYRKKVLKEKIINLLDEIEIEFKMENSKDIVYLNGKSVNTYGSQGQNRTVVLSLKMSELQVIKDEIGENPILLLDDFMSELDKERRNNFLKNIGDTQVIITCTDKLDIENLNFYMYNVINGEVFFEK